MKKYRIQINFKLPLVIRKVVEAPNKADALHQAKNLAYYTLESAGWDITTEPYIKKKI